MPADISRESRIHLALWRKAFNENGLSIKLSSTRECHSMRLAMYRSAQPFRDDEFSDPIVHQSLQKFAISIDKEKPILHFKEKISLGISERLMGDFGFSDDDLLLPDEAAMQSRLIKELDSVIERADPEESAENPLRAKNKFY